MTNSVEDWLKQDNLSEAIVQAQQEAFSRPNDESIQFLLFELLALTENFDESERALLAAMSINPSLLEMFELYRGILNAERIRHNVTRNAEGTLSLLTDLPAYSGKFLSSIKLISELKVEEAEILMKRAYQDVPKVSGEIDGVKFIDIRDSNDQIYPFLEVLTPNHYFWVPFSHICRIEFKRFTGYQNTIWMPAYLELKGKIKGEVWIPSLYSGTGSKEDICKMGKLTIWENISTSINRAYGQRDFLYIDLYGNNLLKAIRQVSLITFN